VTTYDETAVEIVEDALDQLVEMMRQRSIDAKGFNREIVARLGGVSPDEMSSMLQLYRQAQKVGGATKYVIAATGYGRGARWRILAKPGSDPKATQEARRQQAVWTATDAQARIVSDLMHEVFPGLRQTQIDGVIDREMEFLTDTMDTMVRRVERSLTSNGKALTSVE
jgi:hypothetical protein